MYHRSFSNESRVNLLCPILWYWIDIDIFSFFFIRLYLTRTLSVERKVRRYRKLNSGKVNVIANIFSLKRRLGEIDGKIRSLFISGDTSLVSNGGLEESQITELNRLKWTFRGSKDMRIDRASISLFILVLSTMQKGFPARRRWMSRTSFHNRNLFLSSCVYLHPTQFNDRKFLVTRIASVKRMICYNRKLTFR